MTNTNTITVRYAQMVSVIGLGFHPDTPGADYTTLPESYSAEAVDALNDEAREAGLNVYEVALRVVS